MPPPPDHADAEVVAALRAGDADAFGALVCELHPGLVRMAGTYVSAVLAEEVVQDTWMAVVTSIDTFEGRSALKTWIYRIMLNKVRTLARRESRIVPFTSVGPSGVDDGPSVDPDRLLHPDLGHGYWPEAPASWHTEPDARVTSAETVSQVVAAIAGLPAAQREVVTLRDLEGWSAVDVCNALGLSSVNQRVLLHRARVAVRAALEEALS